MVIDWTFNIGTLIQIATIVAAAIVFVVSVKGDVSKVKDNITDIKDELKELRKVMTVQVDHDGRLRRAEADIRDLEEAIKEMRHGQGFVNPMRS